MKCLPLLALALALAAPSLGCRNPHLGPDTGQAYRDALAAQRANKGAAPAALDAGDARAVLRAHRGDKNSKRDDHGSLGVASATTSSSSSTTSLDSGSGSYGPSGRQIRIDAK